MAILTARRYRYVERVIEWLEQTTGNGRMLSQKQAFDIARNLRAEEIDQVDARTGDCNSPKTHAPDCDCASLIKDPFDDDDDAD